MKKKKYCICKCDCGNTAIIYHNSLISGATRSCGCLRSDVSKLKLGKPMVSDAQFATSRLYESYKAGAKKRSILFKISKNDFTKLMFANCYYCGIMPSTKFDNYENDCHDPIYYNGIDRIDSMKGYTKNNVVTCCPTCNYAKRALTQEQFLSWVRRVYLHTFKSISDKTVGNLVDELGTVLIKCFYAQEKVMNGKTKEEIAEASVQAQTLNKRRNELMRALDTHFGELQNSVTEKTYA